METAVKWLCSRQLDPPSQREESQLTISEVDLARVELGSGCGGGKQGSWR